MPMIKREQEIAMHQRMRTDEEVGKNASWGLQSVFSAAEDIKSVGATGHAEDFFF